jgi:hypothetical protein
MLEQALEENRQEPVRDEERVDHGTSGGGAGVTAVCHPSVTRKPIRAPSARWWPGSNEPEHELDDKPEHEHQHEHGLI